MKKLAINLTGRREPIFFLLIALSTFGSAVAETHPEISDAVCKTIKNETGPSAFLLDEHDVISKGPIDFGRHPYKYSHQDFYTIWTSYKLIVTPARIKIESCPNGCLELKKIKSICPMSSTYQIGFSSLDKPSNVSDKTWLPWKVDVTSGFLNVEDPQSLYPIDLKYNFDRRIRGEVYDATR